MEDYGEPLAKRPAHSPAPQQQQSRNSGSADANVTLWQFLLDLLLKQQQYSHIICWTNNEGEFKLLDAEHVAKLWGLKKNKHNMNYDKLSRALRYYYDKNIIKKVMGQKFVYKFVSFPEMVKTENRIPFKKKMESIVNDSQTTAAPNVTSAASGFQSLRAYDVKAGLIQQAQLAAAAQQHMMQQHAAAAAMVEQKYQIPAEHHALYHSDSPAQPQKVEPRVPMSQIERTTPNGLPPQSTVPQRIPDITNSQPSPAVSPVSVCTPVASPSPAPVFDIPGPSTPTPPPKPATPLRARETEVNVKLEIPELDDNRNCQNAESDGNGSISERLSSRQSKLKPDPISISSDVHVNTSAASPLINRSILPSLNTPMFLTSPMFGQRTPLIPGIHFWGPGTLSPVATLSPRFSGLPAGSAFQFPNFAVSPATLGTFSSFADSVFSTASTPNSAANDKKLTS